MCFRGRGRMKYWNSYKEIPFISRLSGQNDDFFESWLFQIKYIF